MPNWRSWLSVKMPMPDKLFSSIPAFTYDFSTSYSTNNTSSSRLWTCRVYPFPPPSVWSVVWTCGVYFFIMRECRTVRHLISPVSEWTKTLMPEPVRYRGKRTPSGTGMLRYGIEIQDAGISMPAASASMPIPSYDGSLHDWSVERDM